MTGRSWMLVVVGIFGCGGAPQLPPPLKVTQRPDAAPPFETPARWASFPETAGTPLATLALPGGECLVMTDDGQRWKVAAKDPASPCDGVAYASGSPAVEGLVHAEPVAEGYRFIGAGGVAYTSRDPLGPFLRVARAPVTLTQVASHGSTVLGVDEAGATWTLDGSWKLAKVPPGLVAIDVDVDASGRALWIGAPETLLVSSDAGRTFGPPPGATPARVGAYEVGRTASGQLAARGLLGGWLLGPGGLTPSAEPLAPVQTAQAILEPAPGPRAGLLLDQLAALDGARYYQIGELTAGSPEGARWSLSRGELGEPPDVAPLVGRDACDNVKVGARGPHVVLLCVRNKEEQSDLSVELFVSRDEGASFAPLAELRAQTFGDLSFAVGPDGSALVLGSCATEEARGSVSRVECAPRGPVWVRADGPPVEGSTPHLQEHTARAPQVSVDGRALYFLGTSRKEDRAAVFVSRDGGKSYVARLLEAQPAQGSWEDEGSDDSGGRDTRIELPDNSRLSLDEAGTMGLVVDSTSGFAYATLDADGRVQNLADVPEYGAQIGGAGSRVLAVGYRQNDGVLRAWESLDGGSSWSEIATTQAVMRFLDRGDGAMLCSGAGCVLGDELLRIGWEGQAEAAIDVIEEVPPYPESTLSAPIVCQLTPKTEWMRIAGRGDDTSNGGRFPRLRELSRGKTLWSVAAIDEASGAIDVVAAAMPEALGPTMPPVRKSLIGPGRARQGARVLSTLQVQNEGFAAMRGVAPVSKLGTIDGSGALDGLEVAWVNHYLGVFGKRTVKLEGAWGGVVASGALLRPALLTVAGSGIVVQADAAKRALFVDAQAKSTSFDYPTWGDIFRDARPPTHRDALVLGGIPHGVSMVDRAPSATIIAVARSAAAASKPARAPGDRPATPWISEATTVARAGREVEWMYGGDRVGFTSYGGDVNGFGAASATGWLLETDGKLGAPFELPTLSDLPDRPKPCSAEQRKSSPRAVSPHFGRTGILLSPRGRRAVLITDANAGGTGPVSATFSALDPVWMLTDGAVLHGTPRDPCLAAVRASTTRSGGAVAVLAGDLEHAWMLRSSPRQVAPVAAPAATRERPRWTTELEARPMTCRVQPDLGVPVEVTSRVGQRMADDQP